MNGALRTHIRQEPPVKTDGPCAQCGKPRHPERSAKYAQGQANGDPFCSSPCAREWHGTPSNDAPLSSLDKPERIPQDPTMLRRKYRDRHAVPCDGGCGKKVEGKGRNHDGGKDRPHLCVACWHKHTTAERKGVAV